MDWQQITALSIVGGTVGVFLWSKRRPRDPGFHCKSNCGCPSSSEASRSGSITYQTRKGEPAKIIVKFK